MWSDEMPANTDEWIDLEIDWDWMFENGNMAAMEWEPASVNAASLADDEIPF